MKLLHSVITGTVVFMSLACGNPFGPSAEEIAKQEADAKAAANAKLKAEMKELASSMMGGMDRLGKDPTFTNADLDSLRQDVDKIISLINDHPEIADGKAMEMGGAMIEFRDFLAGVKMGDVDVDAKTGGQSGQRIEKGYLLRIDVLSGEWTAKAGSTDWPPNPGTGYPAYRPGWTDFRSCQGVTMGAVAGRAGNTCFAAGDWYEFKGAADTLWFTMNDSMQSDNSGLLEVRWRMYTKKPDLSKFEGIADAN